MSEPRVPSSWLGRDVFLNIPEGQYAAGTLEEVSNNGIVLRMQELITWEVPNPEAQADPDLYGPEDGREYRLVSWFYPWHSIISIRVLEEV